jgi:hypothetical protein
MLFNFLMVVCSVTLYTDVAFCMQQQKLRALGGGITPSTLLLPSVFLYAREMLEAQSKTPSPSSRCTPKTHTSFIFPLSPRSTLLTAPSSQSAAYASAKQEKIAPHCKSAKQKVRKLRRDYPLITSESVEENQTIIDHIVDKAL